MRGWVQIENRWIVAEEMQNKLNAKSFSSPPLSWLGSDIILNSTKEEGINCCFAKGKVKHRCKTWEQLCGVVIGNLDRIFVAFFLAKIRR